MKKLFLRTSCEVLDITGFVEVLDNTVINKSLNHSIGKFPKECSTIIIKSNGDITVSQCAFSLVSERIADLSKYGFVYDDSVMMSEQISQSIPESNNELDDCCYLQSKVTNVL